jgi:hypothetical protein
MTRFSSWKCYTTVTSNCISATVTYVVWREERLWNVRCSSCLIVSEEHFTGPSICLSRFFLGSRQPTWPEIINGTHCYVIKNRGHCWNVVAQPWKPKSLLDCVATVRTEIIVGEPCSAKRGQLLAYSDDHRSHHISDLGPVDVTTRCGVRNTFGISV